jgi:redox-sensitive bicupin YhaK (pirin superfamily)
MMEPRYQEIRAAQIPVVALPGGAEVRVISGTVGGVTGPVRDIVAEPEYLDVTLPPGAEFSLPVRPGYLAAAYIIGGSGVFDQQEKELGNRVIILFGNDGDSVRARAGDSGVRFLYISGKPLHEPIAWGGPIVMNTKEELQRAFEEYERGTFIRKKA